MTYFLHRAGSYLHLRKLLGPNLKILSRQERCIASALLQQGHTHLLASWPPPGKLFGDIKALESAWATTRTCISKADTLFVHFSSLTFHFESWIWWMAWVTLRRRVQRNPVQVIPERKFSDISHHIASGRKDGEKRRLLKTAAAVLSNEVESVRLGKPIRNEVHTEIRSHLLM